ncbi:hypothetical protein [Streptomyces kaempferi]|uniref:Uncharacterized protein n=1 Tax=Streptomyces kaempferi TaxID=333725 RepID=A0ABW3XXZ9_9ACTN
MVTSDWRFLQPSEHWQSAFSQWRASLPAARKYLVAVGDYVMAKIAYISGFGRASCVRFVSGTFAGSLASEAGS